MTVGKVLCVGRNFIYRRFSKACKMPSAVVLLAEGAEEMEAVITVDVMRRAEV
jgi:hypothetical protein